MLSRAVSFLFFLILGAQGIYADSDHLDDWKRYVDEDYAVAQVLMEKGSHYASVCFHSHQAVEKELKRTLYEIGFKPEKTHHTSRLASKLKSDYPELQHLKNSLRWLDGLYLPSRYPQKDDRLFNAGHAEECLRVAHVVRELFQSQKLRV